MNTSTTIGEELAAARKAAGMSVSQAAAELGVDRTTLFRWENGTRTPAPFAVTLLRGKLEQWNARKSVDTGNN